MLYIRKRTQTAENSPSVAHTQQRRHCKNAPQRRRARRELQKRGMRGEAWGVGATRSGIFRCERCAAAV